MRFSEGDGLCDDGRHHRRHCADAVVPAGAVCGLVPNRAATRRRCRMAIAERSPGGDRDSCSHTPGRAAYPRPLRARFRGSWLPADLLHGPTARKRPISVLPLAEIVPTWAISEFEVTS